MVESKYIGLILALSSAFLTGASYIVTKKGLMKSKNSGTADGHSYLQNRLWWCGMLIMVVGELANFAAYSYAPAILVTPLGALSVLVSSILATVFLDEALGRDGIVGCALCLIGSLLIVLRAPQEKPVESMDEMLGFVLQAGFMTYSFFVISATCILVYYLSPRYGKTNPLVYISICSLVGSMTVIACKAFGIALQLTFAGQNQFGKGSTYLFILVTFGCIAMQMNYFNKALDIYSTSVVTPIYYVFFTTATILASIILFQGIYDSNAADVLTMFCGFAIIFIGVFLLNAPKIMPRRYSMSLDTSSIGNRTLLHNFDPHRLGFVDVDENIEGF
eukprot:Partr_v1_DN26177_c0_g1_i1_m10574 putative NIPA-like domain containing